MQIEFVASVAVITPNPSESRRLYMDALGLPLQQLDGEYFASEQIAGCKHFGVWPLNQAAQACFGTASWPDDVAVPQVSLEFEVADADAVAAGADELRLQGYRLLHDAREEPWGQTVARLISPEGAVVGLSYAPAPQVGGSFPERCAAGDPGPTVSNVHGRRTAVAVAPTWPLVAGPGDEGA